MFTLQNILFLITCFAIFISLLFNTLTAINLRKIFALKQDVPPVFVVSFWATIEVQAWARDFNYADYLNLHTQAHAQGAPLCESAYYGLRKILNDHMELKRD